MASWVNEPTTLTAFRYDASMAPEEVQTVRLEGFSGAKYLLDARLARWGILYGSNRGTTASILHDGQRLAAMGHQPSGGRTLATLPSAGGRFFGGQPDSTRS
jgi:hypothetical protein